MAIQITAEAFSFEKQDVSLTKLHYGVYASTLWRYAYQHTVSAVICCTHIYNDYIKALPNRLLSLVLLLVISCHFSLTCQKLFHFR